jgi:hypothetical protein
MLRLIGIDRYRLSERRFVEDTRLNLVIARLD